MKRKSVFQESIPKKRLKTVHFPFNERFNFYFHKYFSYLEHKKMQKKQEGLLHFLKPVEKKTIKTKITKDQKKLTNKLLSLVKAERSEIMIILILKVLSRYVFSSKENNTNDEAHRELMRILWSILEERKLTSVNSSSFEGGSSAGVGFEVEKECLNCFMEYVDYFVLFLEGASQPQRQTENSEKIREIKNKFFDEKFKVLLSTNKEQIRGFILDVQRIFNLKYNSKWDFELRMKYYQVILKTCFFPFGPPGPPSKEKFVENLRKFEETIVNFGIADSDPRVRETCLKCLKVIYVYYYKTESLQILKSKIEKLSEFYGKILSLLEDHYTQVKCECIKFLRIFSQIFKNVKIRVPVNFRNQSRSKPEEYKTKLRKRKDSRAEYDDDDDDDEEMGAPLIEIEIQNEVFLKLSKMIGDSDSTVKKVACMNLGLVQNVKEELLLKSLYKKSGQFELHTDPRTLTEINGCLIFGLEDECERVRLETIQAMEVLARQSIKFTKMSLNLILELFNDDIKEVRTQAIRSITKMFSETVYFNEKELYVILVLLEDKDGQIRERIRELLSNVKLSSPKCLHATVMALLTNISKMPDDIPSIFRTLASLGLGHPFKTEYLISDLLGMQDHVKVPEKRINDIFHIAKLMVVFNAASNNKNVLYHLPKYVKENHYYYLKRKFKDLIPELKI